MTGNAEAGTELRNITPPGQEALLDEELGSYERGNKIRQFVAGITANILAITLGTILGWTSPSLRHLEDADSTLPITKEENSWISSLMPLAAAVGPFAAGVVAQKFGRKRALLIVAVPTIISYICLAVADAVWILYLGRVLAGIVIGWSFTVLPMYTGEVAEKEYRGAMGTMIQFSISVGLLFDYGIGPYTDFPILSWASLLFPALFVALFFFVPESPYFLLQQGREQEAREALQWLRGKTPSGVANELKLLKTEAEETSQQAGGLKDIFSTKPNRKSVALCVGLVTFQQLSGINVVLFNAENIFASAAGGKEGGLAPDVSTIIVGVVMLLAAFPTPILVEKLGRKVLLIASAVGMCVSLAVLGLCFFLDEQGHDTSSFSFLPVVAVLVFLVSYSPGFGPLPWAVMGEMYPGNIKALGSTITASAAWIMSFLMTRFFNDLVEAIGNSYTFWLFAIFCFIATFFVFFLVPETKGKTVAEIQLELS